ncbi:MAG: methyltransferase domain-containing protein, partial [Candidatus Bathyarchaeota archaeon]
GEQDAKMKMALSCTAFKKDSLVLDVGCGTGLLFERVGKSVRLLVGLDISSRILKEAKRRVKRFPTTAVVRADADFTPFRSDVFDVTFAMTLLQNVPDPLVALREMKRVSKDRAFIAITGLKKEFSREAFVKLLQRVRLNVSVMESSGELKGYVAMCWKGRKHLKERFGSY